MESCLDAFAPCLLNCHLITLSILYHDPRVEQTDISSLLAELRDAKRLSNVTMLAYIVATPRVSRKQLIRLNGLLSSI